MKKWIEWKGGNCPVDENVLVDVITAYDEVPHTSYAGELDWRHDSYFWPDGDIVAYRLSKDGDCEK